MCCFVYRKLRGNQTKYSPSPRHAPPPHPTPYQISFKKSNEQDSKTTIQKTTVKKVTIEKVDGKFLPETRVGAATGIVVCWFVCPFVYSESTHLDVTALRLQHGYSLKKLIVEGFKASSSNKSEEA